MPISFNPLQNYVPSEETLNALPPYPFEYTPPAPPSYIAPAPSLEEMYAGMQPYMQTGRPSPYDYYVPALNAALDRYRHAEQALPRDAALYDSVMNTALRANEMERRADFASDRIRRYRDAYSDGTMLPQLMGAY